MYGKALASSIIAVILVAFGFGASLAQTPASPPLASPPLYSIGPVTNYDAAVPDSKDVLRFRRGERYSVPNPNPEQKEIGEDAYTGLDLSPSHFHHDPMPFKMSDAVVVGKITGGQAYLSNDKLDIYTEFHVSAEEVMKTGPARFLRAGDSIDIERHGGLVRLPSGKIIKRGASVDSMPLIGKRYLLFLEYDPSTEHYHLHTGYQIEGGHVYGLDDRDNTESYHLNDIHPLREEDANADEWLSRVRTKVSGGRP